MEDVPLTVCQPPNKQLPRTVKRQRVDAASAPFHYALASRFTPQRTAAELRVRRRITRGTDLMTHSKPKIRIEPATEHDIPALLRLIHSFAEYVLMAGEVTATEEDLRQTLFDAKPKADVLMAHHGSEAIGFAVFCSTYSTFLGRPGLYLEDLFILSAWRNQGLGTQLLASVARIAIDRGCARMEWSAFDWNESAVRFYEGLGAEAQVGSTTFRLTADSLRRLGSRHSA